MCWAGAFEPGAVLTIELTTATEERQRLLLARVDHATFQPEDKNRYRLDFADRLGEDETGIVETLHAAHGLIREFPAISGNGAIGAMGPREAGRVESGR